VLVVMAAQVLHKTINRSIIICDVIFASSVQLSNKVLTPSTHAGMP